MDLLALKRVGTPPAAKRLLQNAGIILPWQIRAVDSTGDVGTYTSLAFSPDSQPAISY